MMKNILMVIPTLGGGGAEKNFKTIATKLHSEGHYVKVLTLLECDVKSNGCFTVESLCGSDLLKTIPAFIKYVILNKSEFDIFIFTLTQVNVVYGLIMSILTVFSNKKIIYRESNIPSIECKNLNYGMFYKMIYKLSYGLADKVIAQSQDMKIDISKNFGVCERKIVTINNPVDSGLEVKTLDKINGDTFNIICIGRLHSQKRYDRVIDIASKLKKNNVDFKITIYGIGPEEKYIRESISDHYLNDYVFLAGFSQNISSELLKSDCLLITSDYEGFPNSVIEAISMGVPVVSHDFLGGINEIIIDGFNGYIFKQIDDGVESLIKVSKHELASYKEISVDARRRFSRETILKEYMSVIC